jgi:hypothetical protein
MTSTACGEAFPAFAGGPDAGGGFKAKAFTRKNSRRARSRRNSCRVRAHHTSLAGPISRLRTRGVAVASRRRGAVSRQLVLASMLASRSTARRRA